MGHDGAMRRVHVLVRGRVQGVGYRYTAAMFAKRFGVAGWVRNLTDGAVEAEVEGSTADVDQLLEWMAHGPPGARVDDLDVSEIDECGQIGFEVRESS